VVAIVAALAIRRQGPGIGGRKVSIAGASRLVMALAAGAAYGSHILLDWMGSDDTPPIGIMALWPFTDAFYQSDLYWFMAISRRYWLANFWTHNLTAVFWEIVLLGPLAAAIVWWRHRRPPRVGVAGIAVEG
jgi:hypothetical protein